MNLTKLSVNQILLILIFFSSLALAACRPAGTTSSQLRDDHDHHADAPAVHGMLVFGKKSLWLSHLPMFHKPHDYQVIMQVTLKKNGEDLLPFYLNDREQSGAVYYTFVPKKFSMTHLVAGHLGQIEGTLVRGHFERGGVPLVGNVIAKINSIPVKEQFVTDAVKSEVASYYVLGDEGETWLAHKIVAKPLEFDHVLAVKVSSDFWEHGVSGNILTTAAENVPDSRLVSGAPVEAQDQNGLTYIIEPGVEVYNETGDLDL